MMSMRDTIKRLQNNNIIFLLEFVLISVGFILFVSTLIWASQPPGEFYVGVIAWPWIIPPPPIYESLGLTWYTIGVSFVKVLMMVSITYSIIVGTMIVGVLWMANTKNREIDRI